MSFPRAYPGEALDKLAAMSGDAAASLRDARERSAAAREALRPILDLEGVSDEQKAFPASLLGDAARNEGLATVFEFLIGLKAAESVSASDRAACAAARDALVGAMADVEKNKPDWVVPASLQSLSVLLAFLDKLAEGLKGGSIADLDWTV